jgi:hypothetical protein
MIHGGNLKLTDTQYRPICVFLVILTIKSDHFLKQHNQLVFTMERGVR